MPSWQTPALLWALLLTLPLGCQRQEPSPPAATKPAADRPLAFAAMADDAAPIVLPDFEREFGALVVSPTYEVPEEAAEAVRRGAPWDVVVLEPQLVPGLVAEGLLAEIDYRNVPNFRNISPEFRNLAFDPGNRHAVPYSYGTTGLLVRTDLVETPVRSWTDLWDPRFAGRVAVREQMRELMAIALLSLGRPPNSEDPGDLEAALDQLLRLREVAAFVGPEPSEAVPRLVSGEIVILQGWAEDYWEGKEEIPSLEYVLPAEGTLLWYDVFAIPARSPNKAEAERLIDFLLRPEVAARIVGENSYASANEAARPLVRPEVRDDAVVHPPTEDLRKAHFYRPLSPEGEKRYEEVWRRFRDGRRDTKP